MNESQRNVHQLLSKLELKTEKLRSLMLRNRSNHQRNIGNYGENNYSHSLKSTIISIKISRSGRKMPVFLPTFNDTSTKNQKFYPLKSKTETNHKEFKVRTKSVFGKRIINSGSLNRSGNISIPFGMILKSSPKNLKANIKNKD